MGSNAKRRIFSWLRVTMICQLYACTVPGGDGIVGTGVTVPKNSRQGPYLKSAELISHALNADGTRLGDTRTGKFDDATGTVHLITDRAGPVLLVNNGNPLNEITGKWSDQWLSLRTVCTLKESESPRVAINTLTHITHKRVLKLMSNGINVETARDTAVQEAMLALRSVLRPVDGDFSLSTKGSDTPRRANAEAYLAALSAVLQGCALERFARQASASPDSELTYLLNALAVWLREEKPIPQEVINDLRDASRRVRPDIIRDILVGRGLWPKNRVANLDNPLDAVLDTDGDGTVNREDSDIDGDGTPNSQDYSPYNAASF